MFWVISVYFNIRNTLPKSGIFLLGHPIYIYTHTHTHTYTHTKVIQKVQTVGAQRSHRSSHHTVQTLLQAVFTFPQHWRKQTLHKQWRSEGCSQAIGIWTGGGGLWRRHTKTHHRLWLVPECWWWLCRKTAGGFYISDTLTLKTPN